jgi:hypothetical protein
MFINKMLCIVRGIIDDIINTAVKTAEEVDEQKTKFLQHFINKNFQVQSGGQRVITPYF